MKVLFISHRVPYPPTFGSRVRAFNVIRHLAQQHDVTVLSLARNDTEMREAAGIAPFCAAHRVVRVHEPVQVAKMLATLPTAVTASEAFFHSVELQREVDRQVARRDFDLAFGHCSAVGRYLERLEGLPRIIDFCDVDSLKWRDFASFKRWPLTLGYRWEAYRLAAAERRIAGCVEQVTVATPGEVGALAEIGVTDPVDWFANGVDHDYFQPASHPYDPEVISFVGRMDYFPNSSSMLDFCADVWPALRRARPGLRLQIVGAAPTSAVRALGRIDGVTVTGSVPDVRPYVQRSALTIAPLKIARGTQNKILESMAMAVPVVASRAAARGVDAVVGQHLLAADTPDELVESILALLSHAGDRKRLADAGRARVLSHHRWTSAMKRLDAIIDACRRQAPRAQALAA
jgi:sugar transferase (PEP-CTERM/EpsH1 system associated)